MNKIQYIKNKIDYLRLKEMIENDDNESRFIGGSKKVRIKKVLLFMLVDHQE